MKIIDKIKQYQDRGERFFSLEFFPPKTDAGVFNLYGRLDRMLNGHPLFVDITWGAGGSSADKTLAISQNLHEYFGVEVMMHLTCTNMPVEELRHAMKKAWDSGIHNFLALRGDPAGEGSEWKSCDKGLSYASELVELIRKDCPNNAGIAVAGYPEGHAESGSLINCVEKLKMKVDAGADFVVTQLFYDVDLFFEFEAMCRDSGIGVPIIPGIMPIQNYARFRKFVDFCDLKVPVNLEKQLDSIKSDDAKVQKFGIEYGTKMCEQLLERGVPGLHFYTLNLETSVQTILSNLGMLKSSKRAFPWRQSGGSRKESEEVRPIFWNNRPASYQTRTMNWDDFPNGRWGDSRSPTFGDLNDYYLFKKGSRSDSIISRRRRNWGVPSCIEELSDVFVRYIKGDLEELPWCEGRIRQETQLLERQLVNLNRRGMLTINSQPQVNGVPSSDRVFGWGEEGGYVYQKSYLEFFTSPKNWQFLKAHMQRFPSLSWQAVNHEGSIEASSEELSVNAVTWGVFPGKEIVQPTIVDRESFLIWKEEAFALWLQEWTSLADGESCDFLRSVHDKWFLVNVVENDYVEGDIFRGVSF